MTQLAKGLRRNGAGYASGRHCFVLTASFGPITRGSTDVGSNVSRISDLIHADRNGAPLPQFRGCELRPLKGVIFVLASLFEPTTFIRIRREQTIIARIELMNNE